MHVGEGAKGHMQTEVRKHFTIAKNGSAVVDGFIVDGDRIHAQGVFEHVGNLIKGATSRRSGDNSWYLPAGVRPIADKIKGIGRLVKPPAFQEDLDTGDGSPQRSNAAKPRGISDVFSVMNDWVPAVAGVDIPIRVDIEAGKDDGGEARKAKIVIYAVVSGIEASAIHSEVLAVSLKTE
jgi:hypothetical protein